MSIEVQHHHYNAGPITKDLSGYRLVVIVYIQAYNDLSSSYVGAEVVGWVDVKNSAYYDRGTSYHGISSFSDNIVTTKNKNVLNSNWNCNYLCFI